MIQFALFFLLGLLCATFIVGLVAPSIWQRAATLTRRRVEAELPLTLTEIHAQQDGLRATHAVEIRKLEMQLKALAHENAQQKITLGQNYQTLKRLPNLEADLSNAKEQLVAASVQTEALQAQNNHLQRETERLQRQADALNGLIDTLRIELAAAETEKAQLMSQASEYRLTRKEATMRQSELNNQLTGAQTALTNEKHRNSQLEEKLNRLIATLSDTQEKLERYDKGPTRSTEAASTQQAADIRDQISQLAAEMVAITAENEGPNSPIRATLAKADNPDDSQKPLSLAKRIQDLPKGGK